MFRTCFRVALSLFAALVLLVPSAASAQQVFANWTSNTTFDFGGAVTGTASTGNAISAVNTLLSLTIPVDGSANYPDVWFTPTPPVGTVWSIGSVDAGGTVGSADLTVTFSQPVLNPRFHFVNLDFGTVDFGGVTVARLSGNPEFEVTGSVLNSTPAQALLGGCEDLAGGNPNGGCGTVELFGPITSVTFTVTDTEPIPGAGDGFAWTLSYDPAVAPTPVVTIPTLDEWGMVLLILLLSAVALPLLRR